MATADEAVNLLEWSHRLDRCLLHVPFTALQTTTDSRLSLLYKITSSERRQEFGILLLDPDTCTTYYEGISLRTLSRRTDMTSSQTTSASELSRIVEAVQAALQAPSLGQPQMKRNIGWEQSRFSGSLSISVVDKEDPDSYRFKSSFDLDPLDHTAQAVLLSSHFVRPLLSLANALAAIATIPEAAPAEAATTSVRSLHLIRHQSLQLLGLEAPYDSTLNPIPSSAAVPNTTSNLAAESHDIPSNLDQTDHKIDIEDSVFFGSANMTRLGDSLRPSSPSHLGDDTISGPANHTPKGKMSADANLRSSPPAPISIMADDDSDGSDTNDDTETRLRVKSAPSAKSPTPDKKPPTPTLETRSKTPPPADTVTQSSNSQNSPSSTANQRLEQRRRRDEIKRIRETADANSAASRKRSRF